MGRSGTQGHVCSQEEVNIVWTFRTGGHLVEAYLLMILQQCVRVCLHVRVCVRDRDLYGWPQESIKQNQVPASVPASFLRRSSVVPLSYQVAAC